MTKLVTITKKGAKASVNNGITVNEYDQGETYELPDFIADAFIRAELGREANDGDVKESIAKAEAEPAKVEKVEVEEPVEQESTTPAAFRPDYEEKSMEIETKEDVNNDHGGNKRRGRKKKKFHDNVETKKEDYNV